MCVRQVETPVADPAAAHALCHGNRPPRVTECALLATLCRFDHEPWGDAYLGPFIPWERRLAYMGFLEIQGRDLWAGFETGSMAGLMS